MDKSLLKEDRKWKQNIFIYIIATLCMIDKDSQDQVVIIHTLLYL